MALNLNKSVAGKDETVGKSDFITDEVMWYIDVIFYVGLHGTLGGLGSVANIINIIVIVKQGFKEVVNISLLGLAISDFGSLFTLLWQSVDDISPYFNVDLPYDLSSVQYLTAAWPHGVFFRTTACITAFLTFERCLCVSMPLKVKDIVTAKTTITVVVLIFAVMFINVIPVYYALRWGPMLDKVRNKTVVGFSYIKNGESIENISIPLSFGVVFGSFSAVTICTVILIKSLHFNSLWRRSVTRASAPSPNDVMSTRDKKVVRVVTLVSLTFIICTLPGAVNLICQLCFPVDYGLHGAYKNTRGFVWAVCMVLEEINCSSTIFIYYKMSSQFRSIMRRLFATGHSAYKGQ